MTEATTMTAMPENEGARRAYRPNHVRRDGDCVVLSIPLAFRRRKGRREIILPQHPDGTAAPQPNINRPLVLALARAWRWQEMLDCGEVGSVDELARHLRLGSTYVARVLRLTALAPDLVDAILAGEEADGLSLRSLSGGVSLDWHDQRRLIGAGPSQ